MLMRQTFNMSQYINTTANKPKRLVSTVCLVAALLLSVTSTHVVKAQTLTGEPEQQKQQEQQKQAKDKSKSKSNQLPSHLSEKFYRQALYFYFQNKPEEALNQLNTNKEYFANTPAHESLFRVGLQISQGLHQNAQTLLNELLETDEHSLEDSFTTSDTATDADTVTDTTTESAKHHLKTETLQTIVLLQLAEQQIAQQNLPNAQHILAKINKLPEGYLAQHYLTQYYIMQQLIAWPEQPVIENLSLNNNSKTQLQNLLNKTVNNNIANITTLQNNSFDNKVPYIVLNQALSAMEQKQYAVAEEKLKRVQQYTWPIAQEGFWQQLFSSEAANEATASEKTNTKQIEQNGIKHYAQLLLAQLYIEQGLFQQGYDQLESFPKNTPFTEQALFLFGYTAFKLQQFNASEVILNTLIKQYPYANFTQQAWALSAEQYTAQQQLNKALNRYLHIETYYQNKQKTLATFSATVAEQTDLLAFYQLPNSAKRKVVSKDTDHTLWVNASLNFGNTPVLYQQLQSVENLVKQLTAQQSKSYWLANTIALNTTRQNNIRTQQENTQYATLLKQLAVKKAELSSLLTQAKQLGNGELFASETEKLQLTRITNSHNALALITRSQKAILDNEPAVQKATQSTGLNEAQKRKIKNYNTTEYQQRLARVQGVLAWQLKQQFSERYWQTQQALNTVDTLYDKTLQQHNKVEALLNVSNTQEKGSLSQITAKHTQLNQHIAALLEKTAQIKAEINQQLLTQSTQFIEQEQAKINQFLLFNQRAMANVIEQLNAMSMPSQEPSEALNQYSSEEPNQEANQKISQSFSQKGAFNDTL